MTSRLVIINADDFGQSEGINRGIVHAHEHGVVTSASLMVRWPAAVAAGRYAREHPKLDVGLHLDLGEWSLRDGEWEPRYKVVDIFHPQAVADEMARQLELFFMLTGRPPTHIDSHQHRHVQEPVRSIVCETANREGIEVRGISAPFCGRFYGQDENGNTHPDWIGVPALLGILGGLTDAVTEVSCHPAESDDLDTMYRSERLIEVQTLCDPRIREAIAEFGMRLVSFRDLKSAAPPERQTS